MQRPADTKISIYREDDMLVVSIPEIPFPGTKFAKPTLGSFLVVLTLLICIGVSNFYHLDFRIAIGLFAFLILPIMVLTIRDFFKDIKELPPSPCQNTLAVVFRKDDFIVSTSPDEDRYYYVWELDPILEDVSPYHDVLYYAVYVPFCSSPEPRENGQNVDSSYEIICPSSEEAQWVLHEIKTFLDVQKLKKTK